MTTRPSPAELRHQILAQLSTHTTEVEWAGTAAHQAFADSVIDWADWLATCETPPPPRPERVGNPGPYMAHIRAVLADPNHPDRAPRLDSAARSIP